MKFPQGGVIFPEEFKLYHYYIPHPSDDIRIVRYSDDCMVMVSVSIFAGIVCFPNYEFPRYFNFKYINFVSLRRSQNVRRKE